MEMEKYRNKYLKYKNKYLEFKQYGGDDNLNYIYFCFNRKQVDNMLEQIKIIINYTPDVIDILLNAGAYKSSFNNEIRFVRFKKLERLNLELKMSDNLPEIFYINRPINIIESTFSLMNFIKLLNNKINLIEEKPVVEKPVVEKPVVEKPVVEKPVEEEKQEEEPVKTGGAPNIKICDVLIFCKNTNKNNYSLVRHYIVNDEIMEENKLNDDDIKFIDLPNKQPRKKSFFN